MICLHLQEVNSGLLNKTNILSVTLLFFFLSSLYLWWPSYERASPLPWHTWPQLIIQLETDGPAVQTSCVLGLC